MKTGIMSFLLLCLQGPAQELVNGRHSQYFVPVFSRGESLPLGRSQGSVSFGMDLEKSGVDRGLGGREREPTEQRCGLY